jgi:hypothetical protein
METRTEKVKTNNGDDAIITMDENNNPISVKVPAISGEQEIPVREQRDKVVEVFENVLFKFPTISEKDKHNKIITPRQHIAFIEDGYLNVGVIKQYVRAGIMTGKTLITIACRCCGAYPFGREVKGRLTICYCYDKNGEIRIILNFYVYKNQEDIPEGEVEKEISFKTRATLGKTIFSMNIPGEKNMVIINKRRREKTFPALCA